IDLPEMFTISGWGSLENGGESADILQKAEVVQESNKNCRRIYRRRPRLPHGIKEDTQICARGRGNQLADTCQGDSGGPLQIKMPTLNIYTIVGITSFGIRCGITASVYTRVSRYVPWVETIVWPGS
ncbi:Trypsin, partial [Oryctes borbonicus]